MNGVNTLLRSDLVHRLGWTLLHSVWQIAALGVVVGLLLETLRRRSANARYAVACVGLVAMIAAPTATWFLLPDRAADGTASVSTPLGRNTPGALPATPKVGPTADVDRSGAALPGEFASPGQTPAEAVFDGRAVVSIATTEPSDQSTPSPAARLFQVCSPWTPWLGAGWMAGVFWLSLWNLGGWRAAQRLRRLGTSVCDEPLAARVAALAKRLGLHGPIRVLCSVLVDTPAVVGALRPVVLVPVGLAAAMPPGQLDAILAHELAHVRRHDYLVNLLQTVVETLLFYHPAVWRLSWRIRSERENCCDDVAVTVCRKRSDYAGALAAMEGLRATASQPIMAAGGGSLRARAG